MEQEKSNSVNIEGVEGFFGRGCQVAANLLQPTYCKGFQYKWYSEVVYDCLHRNAGISGGLLSKLWPRFTLFRDCTILGYPHQGVNQHHVEYDSFSYGSFWMLGKLYFSVPISYDSGFDSLFQMSLSTSYS